MLSNAQYGYKFTFTVFLCSPWRGEEHQTCYSRELEEPRTRLCRPVHHTWTICSGMGKVFLFNLVYTSSRFVRVLSLLIQNMHQIPIFKEYKSMFSSIYIQKTFLFQRDTKDFAVLSDSSEWNNNNDHLVSWRVSDAELYTLLLTTNIY